MNLNYKSHYSFSLIWIALFAIFNIGCTGNATTTEASFVGGSLEGKKAKFEPKDGQVLLFVGQELEAIGGVPGFQDGYLDHFKKPAGWTAYTSFNGGLQGIWKTDTWGDGYSNMSLQEQHFNDMALAIGIDFVNQEENLANGSLDSTVVALGNFIKGLGERPVFLRLGYEFDGHTWNHYDRVNYIKAFRRVKDKFDSLQVTNTAFVWQSTGWASNLDMLEQWYPGDEYVDWCGFSFFSRWDEQSMIEFARTKGKPVFIAEATPNISDFTTKFDGDTKETILSNPEQAKEAWDKWFVPFFKTVDENPDVVKAISYINCHWKNNEMWKTNTTFRDIDARLQTSETIAEQWNNTINQPKYVHSHDRLYQELWDNGDIH
ncbi:MAG: glycosyl hydrolase [Cyclobacteriaceae bacterium]